VGAEAHAPRQRTNRDPGLGRASSVSALPKVRRTVQRLPQSSERLRTVPAPFPTLMMRKFTLTDAGTAGEKGWSSKATLPHLSPFMSIGHV
jgi:hypothetical protein